GVRQLDDQIDLRLVRGVGVYVHVEALARGVLGRERAGTAQHLDLHAGASNEAAQQDHRDLLVQDAHIAARYPGEGRAGQVRRIEQMQLGGPLDLAYETHVIGRERIVEV